MKTAFILFFLLVLLGIEAKAGAPYGIKGQEQSTLYSNVHQFANKQVTNLGGINALVQDCGSSANLLENCGYEAGPTSTTTITGWTLTAGTMVAETTDVKQGKKSLKLEMTSDVLDFYQTSTLNAIAFADGVNGSLGLSVKTTIDNLYQCRTDSSGNVVANTDGTKITNCVKISNSGKWGDYVLPVILGATSNGMRLVSLTPSTAAAVAVTGDVYVDAGILEAGLKATSQGVCTTALCETEFSAVLNGTTCAIVSESMAGWISSVTDTGTGICTITFTGLGLTVIPSIEATLQFTSTQKFATTAGASTTSVALYSYTSGTTAGDPQFYNVKVTKQGTDFTNAKALANGRIYTASCGANCVDSFSAVVTDGVATTTVSKENAEFITGNCTNASAGVYQCTVSGFTVSPNCVAVANGTGDRSFRVDTPNATTVDVNVYSSSGALADSSFTLTCQKTGADFVASRTIVGSFAEVNTSPGIAKPVTCSAKISAAGVISDQKGRCFTSCTNATTPVCTFATSYWVGTPSCWHSAGDEAGAAITGQGEVSSTTFYGLIRNSAGTAISGIRRYFCHGEGL